MKNDNGADKNKYVQHRERNQGGRSEIPVKVIMQIIFTAAGCCWTVESNSFLYNKDKLKMNCCFAGHCSVL